MINFAVDLVKKLPSQIHIGAVKYSNQAEVISYIVESHLRNNLSLLIEQARHTKGTTSTDLGIYRAASLFSRVDLNPEHRRIILLVTDGLSDDTQKSMQAARYAEDHHIHIYGLAVGRRVYENGVRILVSNPSSEYLYRVESPSSVHDQLIFSLQESFCKG